MRLGGHGLLGLLMALSSPAIWLRSFDFDIGVEQVFFERLMISKTILT